MVFLALFVPGCGASNEKVAKIEGKVDPNATLTPPGGREAPKAGPTGRPSGYPAPGSSNNRR